MSPCHPSDKEALSIVQTMVLLGRNRCWLPALIHRQDDKLQNRNLATNQLFYRRHWTRDPFPDDAPRNMEEA